VPDSRDMVAPSDVHRCRITRQYLIGETYRRLGARTRLLENGRIQQRGNPPGATAPAPWIAPSLGDGFRSFLGSRDKAIAEEAFLDCRLCGQQTWKRQTRRNHCLTAAPALLFPSTTASRPSGAFSADQDMRLDRLSLSGRLLSDVARPNRGKGPRQSSSIII
jgi:hypothetical protein